MVDFGSIDKIDIVATRNDGGIDLVIVCVGKLMGTVDIQNRLMDKVENYLRYRNSEEFKNEFGNKTREEVQIILVCQENPDEVMYQLFERIKSWVADNNALFKMEIRKDDRS